MRDDKGSRQTGSAVLWRGALIVAGLAILLWSGVEDRDASGAAALGVFTAIVLTMRLLGPAPEGKLRDMARASLGGALAGALAAVLAAALMLFKDLRHAHPFPDFPPAMLLGMLERLPAWALAGALAGLGLGLLRWQLMARRGLPQD